MPENHKLYPDQIVPLGLTGAVCAALVFFLWLEIIGLNHFAVAREKIIVHLRWGDILVGITIYLKTSIDFAIFIGRLMSHFPGWKNRVMIEVGTAFGNAVGTFAVLLLWDIFREIPWLMAMMIVIAALVLFRLAEEGLEHVKNKEGKYAYTFGGITESFELFLVKFNAFFAPVLDKLVPRIRVSESAGKTLWALFILSFTIPFILGLDDFAGYIPLFNIVNVFGFATGVFLGHMLLNIFLFLSPNKTIAAVKHPLISFFGSVAFVGLGLWGLWEAYHLLF